MGDSGDYTEDGRPVGKTSYMSQSNVPISGTFHRPVNHNDNFGHCTLTNKYSGTQLTDYWSLWHPDDLSTASYYSVQVAQTSTIRVDNAR